MGNLDTGEKELRLAQTLRPSDPDIERRPQAHRGDAGKAKVAYPLFRTFRAASGPERFAEVAFEAEGGGLDLTG